MKIVVSIAAIFYVIYKLQSENTATILATLSIKGKEWGYFALSFFLITINMGLEAAKWKYLLRFHYPNISFFTALKAILAGNTAGIFTPNRVGEYAGRVLFLPEGKRWEAVTLTLMDRMGQMLITLWYGLAAAAYFAFYFQQKLLSLFSISTDTLFYAVIMVGIANFIFTLLLIFPAYYLPKSPFTSPFLEKIRLSFLPISPLTFTKILFMSLLRTLTFSTQYFLLLLALGYDKDYLLAYMMIGLIYLIKSAIPSISLAELGIRESVALSVMGLFGVSNIVAAGSTFLLYLFNIALPALIGVFFVYKIKIGK